MTTVCPRPNGTSLWQSSIGAKGKTANWSQGWCHPGSISLGKWGERGTTCGTMDKWLPTNPVSTRLETDKKMQEMQATVTQTSNACHNWQPRKANTVLTWPLATGMPFTEKANLGRNRRVNTLYYLKLIGKSWKGTECQNLLWPA